MLFLGIAAVILLLVRRQDFNCTVCSQGTLAPVRRYTWCLKAVGAGVVTHDDVGTS